ncbi:hypothetical protein [Streptomyces sp. H39-S7]|uniref:hypothetical protein n=1 Tax=Streptomyces sp. H39-S7 TaxID=3004357 RepID=UPI0022AEA0E5|nr:hypothetical protein [Streptomyces sp. H39-S7]MCZ4124588.1 hypothetical protein [Streptomyces sp. H39-S7]
MGILMTGLISLAGVNIVLGVRRLWRRSLEARMVRQARAWPGLDVYHADLLSAAEPLCSAKYQPGQLQRNSYRAADVAVRLMRQDGILRRDGLELADNAAEPAHPVTAAAFRAISRYQAVGIQPSQGDIGRDDALRGAVGAHLNTLFRHAPATRRHVDTATNTVGLWSYALGAAAPAVHAFLLMRRSAPADPDVTEGSFVLASLVFVAALIVITAQAGNTWHPLEYPAVPSGLRELAPSGEDSLGPVDAAGAGDDAGGIAAGG